LPEIGRRPRELNGHVPFLTALACESNNVAFPFFLIGYVRQQKLLPNRDVCSEGKQPAVRTYLQCRCFFVKGAFAGRVTVRKNASAVREALATSPFHGLRSSPPSSGRVYPAARAAWSFSPQNALD